MKHPGSEEWSRYIDGDFPEGKMNRLREHLAACEECRAIVGFFRSLGEHARLMPVPLWPGIEFGKTWPARVGREPRVRHMIPALAAGVAMVIILGGVSAARVRFQENLARETARLVAEHSGLRAGDLMPALGERP